jgi:hypothetical protein
MSKNLVNSVTDNLPTFFPPKDGLSLLKNGSTVMYDKGKEKICTRHGSIFLTHTATFNWPPQPQCSQVTKKS